MKLPFFIREFGHIFKNAGHECYLVGGAVRNIISGRKVTDFDFATDATPETVQKLFRSVIPTGLKHGTVTVLFKGHHLEVTTFRIEGKYSDYRRPDTIQFTPSIYEDLKRRDFTINAMAYNIVENTLVDPHKGTDDLKKKIIRAIGKPSDRFTEDPLRMMRACRFVAQLEFTIERQTEISIREKHDLIVNVSRERIRDEFIKTVTSPSPGRGIQCMDETGLLELIVPELSACKGITQKGWHKFDVFSHSLLAMDFAENDLCIRLAALFHDLGKVDTFRLNSDDLPTFYGHEKISAQKAHDILQRLKFPNRVQDTVTALIENHMFSDEIGQSDAAMRRFVARVGEDLLPDLFKLRRADSCGIIGEKYECPKLSSFEQKLEQVAAQDAALSISDLDIDGNDLAREAGIPKGPEMGKILSFLLETVIDDPEMNTRSKLIQLARNYYKEYF